MRGDALPRRRRGYERACGAGRTAAGVRRQACPWLPATKALLADAVAAGCRCFGICLGAQLLAEATGGPGAPRHGRAGARGARRSHRAATRPATRCSGSCRCRRWSSSGTGTRSSAAAAGATLLVEPRAYPHQAFRVGDGAWGLQFHVEAPPEMVEPWAARTAPLLRAPRARTPERRRGGGAGHPRGRRGVAGEPWAAAFADGRAPSSPRGTAARLSGSVREPARGSRHRVRAGWCGSASPTRPRPRRPSPRPGLCRWTATRPSLAELVEAADPDAALLDLARLVERAGTGGDAWPTSLRRRRLLRRGCSPCSAPASPWATTWCSNPGLAGLRPPAEELRPTAAGSASDCSCRSTRTRTTRCRSRPATTPSDGCAVPTARACSPWRRATSPARSRSGRRRPSSPTWPARP